MRFYPVDWTPRGLVCRGAGVWALAAIFSCATLAQPQSQEQQTQQQSQQSQTQSQQSQEQQQGQAGTSQQQSTPQNASPQDQAPPSAPPQQNANRPPVTSRDTIPNNTPSGTPPYDQQPYGQPPYPGQYGQAPNNRQYNDQSGPPQYGYGQQYGQQYGTQNGQPQQQFAPPPALLTLPAGTIVVVRTNELLSSDHSQVGDQFTATLQEPLVVGGYVVARRGSVVAGQVKSVEKAGRVKGTSHLGVELTDLTLVDGQQAPILTELWKASGGTSHGADAATIVGGTALGSAIGAAADWGRGAAIGAGAGAVAGIGAVLLTRGRPTVLLPESELSFKLVDPVKVDTTQSQSAFVPPTQQDYGRGPGWGGRGYGYGPGPYPYPPYAYAPAPCGYGYPCYYGYGPYAGYYPGYWWGGVYYRGFYGPRFRRF